MLMNTSYLSVITLLALTVALPAVAANPQQVERLLKTNQCPLCDLRGADLTDANLFGANLVGADLKGATLSGANLGSANLTDADLTGAKLIGTYLDRATLENTNFSQADLSRAYLKNASTPGIKLTNSNLTGANLARTNLIGADLKGSNLSDANLSDAMLSGFQKLAASSRVGFSYMSGIDPAMFTNYLCQDDASGVSSSFDRDLARYGLELVTTDLSNLNFQGANLSGALLPRANLTGANLTNANLTGACLSDSLLKNATLDGANLQGAQLRNAQLAGASLKGTRNANTANSLTALAAETTRGQQEAKVYTGSMMRAQQAYFLENGKFAVKLSDLGIGIESDTKDYAYRVFSHRDRTKMTMVAAVPKVGGLKTFIGLVSMGTVGATKELTTFAKVCQSQEAKPLLPKLSTMVTQFSTIPCPKGFELID
jgi:uncharacterized protein YjbI with pentapeptide repeats